jgi:hypothetical protein
MSIEHFAMFAYGFVSAWICFQIQSETLRRITRRKPRHDRSGPTTPKPEFPPGRVLSPDGSTIGYRPIPSGRNTIPPPRQP